MREIGNCCRICGFDEELALVEHHITPESIGGSDERENLVTLCANCHTITHRIYKNIFERRKQIYEKRVKIFDEIVRFYDEKRKMDNIKGVYDEWRTINEHNSPFMSPFMLREHVKDLESVLSIRETNPCSQSEKIFSLMNKAVGLIDKAYVSSEERFIYFLMDALPILKLTCQFLEDTAPFVEMSGYPFGVIPFAGVIPFVCWEHMRTLVRAIVGIEDWHDSFMRDVQQKNKVGATPLLPSAISGGKGERKQWIKGEAE